MVAPLLNSFAARRHPISRSGAAPMMQIKARLRRTFKLPFETPLGSENQRAALIDCSTASLGQQSTFNPADFWYAPSAARVSMPALPSILSL